MYKTINLEDFRTEFARSSYKNNFSYAGLESLFNYLEDDNLELDIIGICCDFSEHTIEELKIDYSDLWIQAQNNFEEEEDIEDIEDYFIKLLEENLTVFIPVENKDYFAGTFENPVITYSYIVVG